MREACIEARRVPSARGFRSKGESPSRRDSLQRRVSKWERLATEGSLQVGETCSRGESQVEEACSRGESQVGRGLQQRRVSKWKRLAIEANPQWERLTAEATW
ncbi:hypothetical protein Adt_23307 [Abeliophyllum distichum]|uniref:Uncharacterized protein n=1 Tax=Abeliophyllum distichum TaxID=126358 RepID=A0ABD1SAI2_9LAMI